MTFVPVAAGKNTKSVVWIRKSSYELPLSSAIVISYLINNYYQRIIDKGNKLPADVFIK